jgi:lysozyme
LSTLAIAEPALAVIVGPDVSNWQHPNGTSINWFTVKAAGHSFAFVKATEGTSYTNPYFLADWNGILAAGMDRGAYHFAQPNATPNSAIDQANYFISVTNNTREPGDLPPTLDLEVTNGLSPPDLVAWTHSFLSRVQILTGRTPIIYASPSFWTTSMGNSTEFTNYPLWIAQWTGAATPSFPLPGGWTSWTFWQYTNQGSLPGVFGSVDKSRYCCDFNSLSALAFGSTTTEAPPPPPSGGTDFYSVLVNNSGSQTVEIHALSQASHYTQFILQSTSAFRTPTPDWHFYIASFQGDGQPDLIGIKERNTGSGFVEVHVLSAASGYRSFLLHAATPLRPAVVANSLQFAVGSFDGDQRPNLYAILPTNTGSGTVEVHVLSEATNYSVWALHSASALSAAPSTVPNWQFRIGDRYGRGDLVGINHGATGSGHTEVHILSRNSGYQTFSLHAATPMGYTSDSQFAFVLGDHDNDGLPDLYALMMNGSGTGQTEAHILSGASGFTNWIEHTPTGLGPTNSADWQFSTF